MPPEIVRVLGSRVDRVCFSDALERIVEQTRQSAPHHIITTNTLLLLAAEKDPELRQILEHAALSIPESSGLRWAGWIQRRPFPEIVPGIDLFTALCGKAALSGQSIYLLGAKPGVAEDAADNLLIRFPALRIAGVHHGYFKPDEEAALIRCVRESGASCCFVALTVPGQEKWIARHLNSLAIPVVMGVGGSFDVLAGRLQRAPVWMRQLGIEWLYRLIQEPWRWRRIAQLPVFAWKVLRERQRTAQSGQRTAGSS